MGVWKFSSEAEGAAADSSAATPHHHEDLLLRSPAKKTTPPLLFPWRHGTDLPPRLVDRIKRFDKGNYESWTEMVTLSTGWVRHQVPLWRLFFPQWKMELADSCAWAFAQAVASILCNTYHVPLEDITKDEGTIEFKFTTSSDTNDEPLEDDESGAGASRMDDQLLMETKLCNLFQEAHKSGKNKLEVFLRTTPTSAKLHSLHALPALSRSLAENHPKLFHKIQNGANDGSHVQRILKETGKRETTTIAEVLVYCNERFWVRDLETDTIVQGHCDNETRQVIHTVRLERVHTHVPGVGEDSDSNWIITDIDDLLGGNQWFQPTSKKRAEWWFWS